jgi:Plasmid pRiA4b ORF-3-like protein
VTGKRLWSWQLKIELLDVSPKVWRRVVVPETIALGELHRALQVTLGWRDTHPHEFIIGGKRYGSSPAPMAAKFRQLNEARARLGRALGSDIRCFDYIYDFCDDWHHVVIVEDRRLSGAGLIYCSGGQNACPPEDIGSARGYARFLASRSDPVQANQTLYPVWTNGHFDPSQFDLDTVNSALSKLTR